MTAAGWFCLWISSPVHALLNDGFIDGELMVDVYETMHRLQSEHFAANQDAQMSGGESPYHSDRA